MVIQCIRTLFNCGACPCRHNGETGVPLITQCGNLGPLDDTLEKSGPFDDPMGNWKFFDDVMIELRALDGAMENLGPFDDAVGKLGALNHTFFSSKLTRLHCTFSN